MLKNEMLNSTFPRIQDLGVYISQIQPSWTKYLLSSKHSIKATLEYYIDSVNVILSNHGLYEQQCVQPQQSIIPSPNN
jgi:hypothetical protein